MKNKREKSTVNLLIRHLPNSIEAIEKRLDKGIQVEWDEEEEKDGKVAYNKTVTMDFKKLMPKKDKKSSEVGT